MVKPAILAGLLNAPENSKGGVTVRCLWVPRKSLIDLPEYLHDFNLSIRVLEAQ